MYTYSLYTYVNVRIMRTRANNKKTRSHTRFETLTNNGRSIRTPKRVCEHKNARVRTHSHSHSTAPSENFDILLTSSSALLTLRTYVCSLARFLALPACVYIIYIYIPIHLKHFSRFVLLLLLLVAVIVVSRVCTYFTCLHGSISSLVYLIACSRLLPLLPLLLPSVLFRSPSSNNNREKNRARKKLSSTSNEEQQTEKKQKEEEKERTFFLQSSHFEGNKKMPEPFENVNGSIFFRSHSHSQLLFDLLLYGPRSVQSYGSHATHSHRRRLLLNKF